MVVVEVADSLSVVVEVEYSAHVVVLVVVVKKYEFSPYVSLMHLF